jgi:hypothetical protein
VSPEKIRKLSYGSVDTPELSHNRSGTLFTKRDRVLILHHLFHAAVYQLFKFDNALWLPSGLPRRKRHVFVFSHDKIEALDIRADMVVKIS